MAKRQYEPIPPLKLELKFLIASIYLKRMMIRWIYGILVIQSFMRRVDSYPTLVIPLTFIVMSTLIVLPAGHLLVSK